MPRSFSQIYPNQAIAICTREQAAQLGDYDHPIIQVDRRAGVMLTHEWLPVEKHSGCCGRAQIPNPRAVPLRATAGSPHLAFPRTPQEQIEYDQELAGLRAGIDEETL